jgi:large subunit ribosomal protein L13
MTAINENQKTYMAKPGEHDRPWVVVDAAGKTLGRLASEVAVRLRGKHNPYFTPHVDSGEFVVVVNAARIHVTGKKRSDKLYRRHSGYPGGLKTETLAQRLATKPEEVIRQAVKGMLPRTRLGRKQLRKLKVYAGPDHPHQAQQPKPVEIGARKEG